MALKLIKERKKSMAIKERLKMLEHHFENILEENFPEGTSEEDKELHRLIKP